MFSFFEKGLKKYELKQIIKIEFTTDKIIKEQRLSIEFLNTGTKVLNNHNIHP